MTKQIYVIEPDGSEYWLTEEDERWLGMQAEKHSQYHDLIVKECILSIVTRSPEFYEGLGPDAWDEDTVDKIVFLCHHRLTGRLGQLLLSKLDDYLYSYHDKTMREDWEHYVDGAKEI